jgi:hypothetical protein
MNSTDTVAQAGWYAVGGGHERYWDGSAWTEQKRPVPSYLHLIAADSDLPAAWTYDWTDVDRLRA